MARLSPTARRQQIIDAALRVSSRNGLGATTVRDVAAEMGSSSGLIHHYFTSMDDVLAAAFEQAAGADLQATHDALRRCRTPVERAVAFFASYGRVGEDHAFQLWLDAWAEAPRRPALAESSRRLNVAWQRLLAGIIRDGVRDGTLRCTDPRGAAWRMLSLLDGLSLQLAAHPGVIRRTTAIDWAMSAFEAEVGLADGSLRRPRVGRASHPYS